MVELARALLNPEAQAASMAYTKGVAVLALRICQIEAGVILLLFVCGLVYSWLSERRIKRLEKELKEVKQEPVRL